MTKLNIEYCNIITELNYFSIHYFFLSLIEPVDFSRNETSNNNNSISSEKSTFSSFNKNSSGSPIVKTNLNSILQNYQAASKLAKHPCSGSENDPMSDNSDEDDCSDVDVDIVGDEKIGYLT